MTEEKKENGTWWFTFNKLSGAYIQALFIPEELGDAALSEEYFDYLKAPDDFDPEIYTWSGDQKNGKPVLIETMPQVVTETELNMRAQSKIRTKYDYYRQLNLVFDLLREMIVRHNQLVRVLATENQTNEMVSEALLSESTYKDADEAYQYIAKIRANNSRYKEAYADNQAFIYLDQKGEEERLMNLLEGGLDELFPNPTLPHGRTLEVTSRE
ncbi:hypothetical protein [Candidatus Vondammii sp. HM_W22]|uniref:hypothetical protein n=1 Tax=Candidatus Vondammii sp. HM_W22 TaxID=2687299 RepID=UPI001F1425A8|nr:hypothetical protein [Candidatus Vondammii sp. HM_W22]